jgi:precorrin-6B methylase 1
MVIDVFPSSCQLSMQRLGGTLKHATTASFHILPNSSFIRRYIKYDNKKAASLNKPTSSVTTLQTDVRHDLVRRFVL